MPTVLYLNRVKCRIYWTQTSRDVHTGEWMWAMTHTSSTRAAEEHDEVAHVSGLYLDERQAETIVLISTIMTEGKRGHLAGRGWLVEMQSKLQSSKTKTSLTSVYKVIACFFPTLSTSVSPFLCCPHITAAWQRFISGQSKSPVSAWLCLPEWDITPGIFFSIRCLLLSLKRRLLLTC